MNLNEQIIILISFAIFDKKKSLGNMDKKKSISY
jgi:hypothetical protein